MDLKDIKAIIDLMKKNSISEFELEKPDFKIRLKRGNSVAGSVSGEELQSLGFVPRRRCYLRQSLLVRTQFHPVLAPSAGEFEIKSPMVGTFYRSPSPDAAPYVEVGAEVSPDSVVCIIEAMEVMNEIKAEFKGVITQVLVENAKPIEFGQPLFKVRPS